MNTTFGNSTEADILATLLIENPLFSKNISRLIHQYNTLINEIAGSDLSLFSKRKMMFLILEDYSSTINKKNIPSKIITFSLNVIKIKYRTLLKELD